ncbi:MAG: ATP-dependent DNA ligase [Gemmatimonadaceae bacterium]|nr:ATP-dependent DNA ligase [Gemmatimonadaceae bacterium]
MSLPIPRSYAPMEALQVGELPLGEQWQYEPKWDGFRCLAFRDGDRVDLMSKAGKPLGRYFPDLVEALRALDASRFVLDGEIVIPVGKLLSFDELLLRIHPAASRVRTLAAAHPAMLIVFDLLVDAEGESLVQEPLSARREALESFAREQLAGARAVRLSPATTAERTVKRWYASVGSALDGVIAKRRDLPYRTGERTGMQKLKQKRTADCVVGGFRYASKGSSMGSLLLGLYDDEGLLDHVGFCSALSAAQRVELTPKLEVLVQKPGFTGQAPGGPSRWSTKRTSEWEPLATKLVVEVEYDHFTGGRFRHGTGFLRWRPDKAPRQCTMAQVEREASSSLLLLGAATRSATNRVAAARKSSMRSAAKTTTKKKSPSRKP